MQERFRYFYVTHCQSTLCFIFLKLQRCCARKSDIMYILRVLIQACEKYIGYAINPIIWTIKWSLSKINTICLHKNYWTLVSYSNSNNTPEFTVRQKIIRYPPEVAVQQQIIPYSPELAVQRQIIRYPQKLLCSSRLFVTPQNLLCSDRLFNTPQNLLCSDRLFVTPQKLLCGNRLIVMVMLILLV